MHQKIYNSVSEALEAMQRYCAAQDRCQQDIRTKLIKGQIYGEELEQIIAELISEGFLDELRFAKAYVSGKHKINYWGRQKIIQGLKGKEISSYCIQSALLEIDDEHYNAIAEKLICKKIKDLKVMNLDWDERSKIFQFMAYKGFESDLISHILDKLASASR